MGKEFGVDDFANLEGSLNFGQKKEAGGPPPMEVKMADISWVKHKKLDIPYA